MGANTIKTILFSGCVFIDELDANNQPTGAIGSLESTELSIETNIEEKKITSRQCDTFGQTHASTILPSGSTVNIKLLDQPAKTLAMALLADVTETTVGIQTVTDEPATLTSTLWAKLQYRNIDAAGVVVQDVTNTTTYVEGTDYEINRDTGMTRRIESGSIPSGGVHIDYTTGAYTATEMTGGTKTQANVQIRLEGTNQSTGKKGTLLIPKAALRPNGALDFMSGEYLESALSGDIVTIAGNNYSFKFTEYE